MTDANAQEEEEKKKSSTSNEYDIFWYDKNKAP